MEHDNELMDIEYQKLYLLRSMHKMMKFFYITSIIGIISLVISFLLVLGNL